MVLESKHDIDGNGAKSFPLTIDDCCRANEIQNIEHQNAPSGVSLFYFYFSQCVFVVRALRTGTFSAELINLGAPSVLASPLGSRKTANKSEMSI